MGIGHNSKRHGNISVPKAEPHRVDSHQMGSRRVASTESYQDLGIGSNASAAQTRFINRDGSFNVIRRGIPFLESLSPYHSLLRMSWWRFNFIVIGSYVTVNLVFALLYLAIGVQYLNGMDATTPLDKFWEAFFFSTQTFTTVGYGRISPLGMGANTLAALESMAGLLGFALATGLLYGRFSRPNAKLIFSEHAVIAPYHDLQAFMFRIANSRTNQLIEVETQVTLSRNELHNGTVTRKFYALELERKQVMFFHLSWTIVHPIDENSPLYGWTAEQLNESQAEFLVLVKGFDDTFSQTVHTRSSYKHFEVLFNRKFSKIIDIASNGIARIDMHRIHETEPAPAGKHHKDPIANTFTAPSVDGMVEEETDRVKPIMTISGNA